MFRKKIKDVLGAGFFGAFLFGNSAMTWNSFSPESQVVSVLDAAILGGLSVAMSLGIAYLCALEKVEDIKIRSSFVMVISTCAFSELNKTLQHVVSNPSRFIPRDTFATNIVMPAMVVSALLFHAIVISFFRGGISVDIHARKAEAFAVRPSAYLTLGEKSLEGLSACPG